MNALFLFLTASRTRAIWLAALWTLMILTACFLPGADIPKVRIPLADKWIHLLIFAGFSFLWSCVFPKTNLRKHILTFTVSVMLGSLVELVQGSGLVRNRSFEGNDILADALGALSGIIFFVLLQRHNRAGSARNKKA